MTKKVLPKSRKRAEAKQKTQKSHEPIISKSEEDDFQATRSAFDGGVQTGKSRDHTDVSSTAEVVWNRQWRNCYIALSVVSLVTLASRMLCKGSPQSFAENFVCFLLEMAICFLHYKLFERDYENLFKTGIFRESREIGMTVKEIVAFPKYEHLYEKSCIKTLTRDELIKVRDGFDTAKTRSLFLCLVLLACNIAWIHYFTSVADGSLISLTSVNKEKKPSAHVICYAIFLVPRAITTFLASGPILSWFMDFL